MDPVLATPMNQKLDIDAIDADLAAARSLARKYAESVREHFGGRTRQVRLFGSAARGDWTRESDVDVLVLLDTIDRTDRAWLVQRAMELGVFDSGILLQPVPMTEDEFLRLKRRERVLALDVEREGIDL